MRILLLLCVIIISACATKQEYELFSDYFWPDISNPKISLHDVLNEDKILKNMSFYKKFFGIEPDLTPFQRPFAVAVDDEYIVVSDLQFGVIFIIEKVNYRLTILNKLKSTTFKSIVGLDIKDKKLYIVDSEKNIIGRYDLKNKSEHIFNIQMDKPVAIRVDTVNKLMFIVDTKRHLIVVTDMDGNILNEIKGDMNFPLDLDILPDEKKVLILDAMNHRIKVYSYSGDLENTFGSIGNKPGYFSKPKGICVDQYKRVYVSDSESDNLQIFNLKGDFLYFIGGTGIDFAKFYLMGKVYCYKNEIYVSDIFNSRVQVFNSFE